MNSRSPRNLQSRTPFEGLELHFEVDQVKQTFNFEGGLYLKFRKPVFLTPISKFADGFLEEISKAWNVTELQSFPDAFQVDIGFQRFAVFRCLLNVITCNFKGPQLSGCIIDKFSKLPNTTGLNFEDSVSERLRLPERLMNRISEVCGFIVPHGRNFKNLWLSGCFLKDFEGI
ncbi:hypothetical protein RclHR1_00650007 [Rhizophagus clarus]|uniref:Uncharacterized protein n=1 Tax=Rhizophagus clarus TaxID=94130 RepID=A0A2Z6RRY2_9GLOM|nr:hypothetical protein RclHR1_00650007 [Rhizophagus clarus]